MERRKAKKVPYLAVLLPVLLMCMAFAPASALYANAADEEAPFGIETEGYTVRVFVSCNEG